MLKFLGNENFNLVDNLIYPLSKIFHSVYNFFSRPKENGIDPHAEHPVKRMHSSRVSPNGIINLNVGPMRVEDVNLSRELREHERFERARLERDSIDRKHDGEQLYPSYNSMFSCNGVYHIPTLMNHRGKNRISGMGTNIFQNFLYEKQKKYFRPLNRDIHCLQFCCKDKRYG